MDLLPRWIAKMVGVEPKPVSTEPSPHPRKARPPAKKAEAPVPRSAPAVEPTPDPQDIVQPETAPAPDKAPKVEATKPTADVVAPRERLTMAAVTEDRGGLGRQRTSAANGRSSRSLRAGPPTPPAPAQAAEIPRTRGRARGSDDAPGIAEGMNGGRLAMKAPVGNTGLAPSAPRTTATVLPSSPPRPVVSERPVPVAAPPAPAEHPAPPAPPAAAPEPAPPAPALSASVRPPAARHLKDVVRALRIERAPRTALDLLDRHAQELAGNAFAEEALLLRVEAMLALNRQPEVLRLLDGTSLANAATSSMLLVTRGQLRANARRCAEAVADFDLALARAIRPSKQALLGRAQCKKELGDPKGAQLDLDRLHHEYPGESGP
jgi:hypothetical protein